MGSVEESFPGRTRSLEACPEPCPEFAEGSLIEGCPPTLKIPQSFGARRGTQGVEKSIQPLPGENPKPT
jgi:hypothetical protein